ncbi:ABC-2 type transport system permease protein [Jatrophihabitans endophyticus]|uniref:ABC-2 type transport system permease protein n=1 Tax=Jatrophihabitans endophyticus TaxID=1206085 RepID=A0A1M5T4B1_9ACTN|nr:ABC transporter permease [Jatrophihabitans endophyticus]SHH45450.1 ABC-2 type transport system permease protein [Jatrophihabitans endophyticus]
MIAVELSKLARRPRTWLTLVLLNALPTVVAVLLAVTDIAPRPGEGPAFLSAVVANGQLFAVAALAIVLPLFLPIAVAVVAGDSVAGEAQAGTLRYLIARPAGRTRLLVAKLVTVLAFTVVAVVLVAGVGYVVGTFVLGTHPETAATSLVTVSGSDLSAGQLVVRTALAMAFVALSMLGVAAMALLLSTFTDSPLGATLGALAFLIGSSLLLTLDAARPLQPYLPTRYWLSFVDLFRDPILWRDVERGALLQLVYVAVFLGVAWANFATKDITS